MRKTLVLGVFAALVVAFARARRGWFPVRVDGESMTPTLQPGDLLAVRPMRRSEPRVGQLIVVRRGDLEVVKRVSAIVDGHGLATDEIWLTGDNADASTDSRTTGPAARTDVIGVVRARYAPFRTARRFAP
ncbi:MAG TPA: S26 family signal peptidase [Actinomycetota bacterium]|nr:S26 family signal peptidase [Actinomycetota bacterium]